MPDFNLGERLSNRAYHIEYLGGHPLKTDKAQCVFHIYEYGIEIDFMDQYSKPPVIHIPLNEVVSCNIETKEQIEDRITLTRMLAFGIYSFAMKKKEKKIDKYLTLVIKNEQSVESIIIFNGEDCPEVHSQIIPILTNFRKNNPIDRHVVQKEFIPFEELKKLKELLDLEIITQDEFNIKKKELLKLQEEN